MRKKETGSIHKQQPETRWRARLIGGALAALTVAPAALFADILDDFNGAQKWAGVNNPSGLAVFELADGTLRMAANFTSPTDPQNPLVNFADVYYLTNLVVHERQTLELRVDLVSASHDNLFAYLGTMCANGGEYAFFKDMNEIGLLKGSATDGLSLPFWETQSIKNDNVVLVLALTPVPLNSTSEGLLIETKVIDKESQVVLFERTILDTPDSDWAVPSPLPHGWKVFGPDAGAPYADDLTVVWVAMIHHTDGQQGLAEARFDNLEYGFRTGPYFDIEKSVLLSLPELGSEEQIVVGTDSLAKPDWRPVSEPIFKRFGELCMAVPTAPKERYFKPVPGSQVIDNFDPLEEPFAARNPWKVFYRTPGDNGRFTFTIADGVFRIETVQTPVDGQFMIFVPGGGPILRDFVASVDILDWASSGESQVSIAGRVQGSPAGVSNAYLGSVRMNPSIQTGRLWIFNGSEGIPVSSSFTVSREFDYRLEFSVLGNRLQVRLYKIAEPLTLVAQGGTVHSEFTQGRVALWVNTQGTTGYMRTLDNFLVTGTAP